MKVLLVYAHPEPRSLNGSIRDFVVKRLTDAGHEVRVSDLYAMNWKPALDAADSIEWNEDERFDPSRASARAFANGHQSADIAAEQEKLLWADALILQFPLWWFSMPAILKGWVDRVYANGFAYGVGEHSDRRWGNRYGEGNLSGKRAMLIVTTGGWESHYSARGINGPMNDVLFPIQHGILYYPGFDVVPPFVVYRTSKVDEARFEATREALGERLDRLWETAPIPFLPQNGGAYAIPELTLNDDFSAGKTGFGAHVTG